MNSEKQSFFQFWSKFLREFSAILIVTLNWIYCLGGSILIIVFAAFFCPISLIFSVPSIMYYYYWMFGNQGKNYDAFIRKMEKWADKV